MSYLIAILLFFHIIQPEEPKCPPLRSETTSIYESVEEYVQHARPEDFLVYGDGYIILATTTYNFSTGEELGVKVGEKPDLEAVEYNKRVRECQVINGEF
jgi:hypothetical protein